MNRRQAVAFIFSSVLFSGLPSSFAKKKKKKKKKKNKGRVKKTVTSKKISGEVILSKENITKTYKLLGTNSYCISKAVEGKVSSYVGQNVTIFGKVVNDKIITIEAITVKISSPKQAKKN